MTFSNFAIEAGVNSAADTKPAASASDPASAPSGNAPAPAPAPASDTTDADELDFGLEDESDTDIDDGTSGDDDGSAPAAEIVPLGPPEGATRQQVADWRQTHGIPDAPSAYQPPAVDGVNWNTEALAPVLAAAHEHNIPQGAVEAALEAYAEQVQQQQADLARQNKERMSEARQRLTPSEKTAINAASSAMSPDLRRSLKSARTASGEPLLANQEFLALIAGLNRRSGNPTNVTRAQDDAARMDEIKQVLRRDVNEYFARGLDKEYAALLARQAGRA